MQGWSALGRGAARSSALAGAALQPLIRCSAACSRCVLRGVDGVVQTRALSPCRRAMDFNELLRESRRLESHMEGVSSSMRARPSGAALMGGGGMGGAAHNGAAGVAIQAMRVPPLTRSLAQLDVAAAKLMRMAGTGAPISAAADSQAQLLLAAKGIDVRKQARALKELQQAQPARGGGVGGAVGPLPIEQFHPLDIERFLQQQQQMLCHSAMEETARVVRHTHTHSAGRAAVVHSASRSCASACFRRCVSRPATRTVAMH